MVASAYPHLLPPNSTALERGLSGPTGRLTAIPTPIDSLWRWDRCPPSHLPWLAWSFSIDVWDDLWPLEKKRDVTRQWVELHRLKGTLEGVRRHIELVGGKVLRVQRPPIAAFAGRSVTPAEHLAYLARFPQVRIYKFRQRGAAKVRGKFPGRANFAGYHMPRRSDAYLRSGSQYVYWDKGVHPLATGEERQINFREELRRQILMLPGRKPRRAAYPNSLLHKLHPVASTAHLRFYNLSTERLADDLSVFRLLKSITPGASVIDVKTRAVTERGVAQFGSQFVGQILHHAYLPRTTSGLRLYDVLYLHDPRRADDGRKARVFAGRQRLGIEPYRAEMTIEIRSRRPRRAKYAGVANGSYPHRGDQRRYDYVKRAIVSAKAYRDKILINTTTTRRQMFIDGIPLDGTRTFASTVSAVY